jgi:hypothetical protein
LALSEHEVVVLAFQIEHLIDMEMEEGKKKKKIRNKEINI